jgi:hypothetical protein
MYAQSLSRRLPSLCYEAVDHDGPSECGAHGVLGTGLTPKALCNNPGI